MAALDRDGVEFFVLNLQVDALVDFVASPLVVGINWLTGTFINQLLTKAAAGLLVDLTEGDALAR